MIFLFLSGSGSVGISPSESRVSVLLSPIFVTSELTKAIIHPETWITDRQYRRLKVCPVLEQHLYSFVRLEMQSQHFFVVLL